LPRTWKKRLSIRIANWNLDRASSGERARRIHELIDEVQADIWVLTETRDSVCPGDGYRQVAGSAANARGDNDERWVSIWTRLAVADARPTNDEEFSACAVIQHDEVGSLAVYGTVLPWRGSVWREHRSADAAAFRAALQAQARDWNRLRDDPRVNAVCVAGDFNQDLSAKHYYWSATARSALRAALLECDLTPLTADDDDPVRSRTNGKDACIDHICITSSLATPAVSISARLPIVDGHRLSDHPAIIADLS
jgi:hypothetical protein